MTRRELCRITAELCECNEHAEVECEYWNAVRANDEDRLTWFASFGDDVRHRVMNVFTYRKNLLFGFNEIAFDEWGWMDGPEWPVSEVIEFKTRSKEDKHFAGNYVTLAAGPNMRWTYSVHYRHGGGSGGGYACHVHWHQPYKTRHAALTAALDEIREKMESGLAHHEAYHDTSNYHAAYMRKVLALINAAYPKKEEQLTLAL